MSITFDARRAEAWLPKGDWAPDLTERHPAFAEGLARVGDVITADGAVPMRYKMLFAAAIAAVKRDGDLVTHFAARAAAAGVSAGEFDGAAVGVLISRGVVPHAALAEARAALYSDPPGHGTEAHEASAEGACAYFQTYFGFVPDYVELLADRAPRALEGYFLMRDAALTGTALPAQIMELLLCAVNAAEYQARFVGIHARGARRAGASEAALVESCLVALPFAGVASWLPAAEGILASREDAQ